MIGSVNTFSVSENLLDLNCKKMEFPYKTYGISRIKKVSCGKLLF